MITDSGKGDVDRNLLCEVQNEAVGGWRVAFVPRLIP